MEELRSLGGLESGEVKENTVTSFEEKRIKKPWHIWQIGGKEYKTKLSTSNILKLEDKYRCNIITLVMTDGIPPLSVMLTIIHAAMLPYHHGISYQNVQKLYDVWAEEGNDQQQLYGKVIMPIMSVSGFFTKSQNQAIMQMIEEELD